METNFQTSFIPKAPMIPEQPAKQRSVSFITVISFLIFFIVLLATGALYFYKQSLSASITQMQSELSVAQNQFEPDKITQLATLGHKLQAASAVLSQHIAVSPILQELGNVTIKNVSYKSFSYSEDKGKITVTLDGVATDYAAVAMQSDFLKQDNHFIDPLFSNFSLDDKGNVLFNLQFSVDPNFVNYEKIMDIATQN
jgi:hypothetical protein